VSTPTTEHVRVNNVDLFTRTIGFGPQVIVLHGGPGAHHDYLLPQFDALATNRRLRYYDQRGGGQSPVDRDVPVGWREQVADLDALITHWKAEPATLLGYSWGALLAMLYATEHADRVAQLALVSPAAASAAGRAEFERRFAERMRDPRIQKAREELQRSGLKEQDPEAYRKRLFELSVAGYFADPERARDLTPFRVTGRTQDAVWKSLETFDLRPGSAGSRCPRWWFMASTTRFPWRPPRRPRGSSEPGSSCSTTRDTCRTSRSSTGFVKVMDAFPAQVVTRLHPFDYAFGEVADQCSQPSRTKPRARDRTRRT